MECHVLAGLIRELGAGCILIILMLLDRVRRRYLGRKRGRRRLGRDHLDLVDLTGTALHAVIQLLDLCVVLASSGRIYRSSLIIVRADFQRNGPHISGRLAAHDWPTLSITLELVLLRARWWRGIQSRELVQLLGLRLRRRHGVVVQVLLL